MKTITTARARLFFKQGYRVAAAAVSRLEVVEENSSICPTMATDGRRLLVNREFMDSLTPAELYWVLVHEGYHCLFRHHIRLRRLLDQHFHDMAQHKQVAEVWNVAADFCINLLIPRREDVQAIEGMLYDPKYNNLSTEEVFWQLWDPEEKNNPRPEPNQTEVQPYDCKPEEVQAAEQREVRAIERLTRNAGQGEIPAGLKQEIQEIKEGKIDYREILSRFLDERCPLDWSYARVNRRYSGVEFIHPAMDGVALGRFVFIGDSSGSMKSHLSEVVGEIMAFIEQINSGRPDSLGLTCLWTDTDVYRQDLEPGDEPVPKGGGGTNFRRALDYLIEHLPELQPRAVIFMTDGRVCDWGEDPGIPVLWLAKGRDFTAPYGEVAALI